LLVFQLIPINQFHSERAYEECPSTDVLQREILMSPWVQLLHWPIRKISSLKLNQWKSWWCSWAALSLWICLWRRSSEGQIYVWLINEKKKRFSHFKKSLFRVWTTGRYMSNDQTLSPRCPAWNEIPENFLFSGQICLHNLNDRYWGRSFNWSAFVFVMF